MRSTILICFSATACGGGTECPALRATPSQLSVPVDGWGRVELSSSSPVEATLEIEGFGFETRSSTMALTTRPRSVWIRARQEDARGELLVKAGACAATAASVALAATATAAAPSELRLSAGEVSFEGALVGWPEEAVVELWPTRGRVELLGVEGDGAGAFAWSALPSVLTAPSALDIRFHPPSPGAYDGELRVWWQSARGPEVTRLRLYGEAFTCAARCALPHAKAACTPECAVASCDLGWTDANGAPLDGCECADPGDISKTCAEASLLPDVPDAGAVEWFEGVLAGPEDVDFVRVFAPDGGNLFSDSFDLRVGASGASVLEICAASAPGRFTTGTCPDLTWSCGRSWRWQGRHFRDDARTVWVRVRGTSRTCTGYRVQVRNG